MKTEVVTQNQQSVAVLCSQEVLIHDVQSALDLMMQVKYETGCRSIAINSEAFAKEFFVLSSCLAGEILQKFINYGMRLAIYGDFSGYTSKPLQAFIAESNRGRDVFFQPDAAHAVDMLTKSPRQMP